MSQQIIHERTSAQHRLIVVRDGIPQPSPWHENREVGLFRGYYFHVGAAGDTVPAVFTVRPVTHESL